MGNLDSSFYFGINLTLKLHASACNLWRLTYQLYHRFALACVFYLEDEKQMIVVWKKADIMCAMGYQLKQALLSLLCQVGKGKGQKKEKTIFIFLFNK